MEEIIKLCVGNIKMLTKLNFSYLCVIKVNVYL